ncbi:MAG: type II toxin-antitoxin system HicB family antitoxin, partial [Dolichospermum sp.]
SHRYTFINLEASKIRRNIMIEYTVIYERGETNWGAYVPDLPGCVSIGDTLAEVEENIKEAIELYLEVLKEDGKPIPKPSTKVGQVAVMI